MTVAAQEPKQIASDAQTLRRLGDAIASVRLSTWAASAILAVVVIAALWPSVLTAVDPLRNDVVNALQPPSSRAWFGTDELGRDIYSRVVHGARYSLFIGITATLLSVVLGVVLGVAAGLSRGVVDEIISRFFDVLGAFPDLLLALLLIAFAGPGTTNVILAIGIAGTTRFARVVRGETIRIRQAQFVEHSRTLGLGRFQLTVRHVLPNVLGPLPVLITLGIGGAILGAAGLSFLGLGPQPPTPEWGSLLSTARNYLGVAPWTGLFAGFTITAAVISFTVLGRTLQRRFEGRN